MKWLAPFTCIVFFGVFLFYGLYEYQQANSFIISDILNHASSIGGSPRVEREFKLGINHTIGDNHKDVDTLIFQTLMKEIEDNSQWKASQRYDKKYKVSYSKDIFLFRDLYFETNENLLNEKNSNLRLRYRWKNQYSHKEFMKGTQSDEAKPTRVEIQSKIERKSLENNIIQSKETRLEFLRDDNPIKNYFEAGKAQALLPLFTGIIKTGRWKSNSLNPIKVLMNHLNPEKILTDSRFYLKPYWAIYTHRNRLHLKLNTPWGSGANPDHTFIVTIDRFWGAPTPAKVRENDLRILFSKQPPLEKQMLEIEIEFERNTSQVLDEEIIKLKETNNPRFKELANTRQDFLDDQMKLTTIIFSALKDKGFEVNFITESKLERLNPNLKKN